MRYFENGMDVKRVSAESGFCEGIVIRRACDEDR